MFKGLFFLLFGEPAGITATFAGLNAVIIDVLNYQLTYNDEWYGEEHSRGTEQLTAKDDPEDDGNWMEVQRLANQRRVDEVMVDLCQNEVEAGCLQCDKGIFGSGQQRAESRSYGRSEYRDELTDTGDHTKY